MGGMILRGAFLLDVRFGRNGAMIVKRESWIS